MGLGRGFSGKSNILGGIKDLLGAAGLGANAFKNGHDTKLIDIAVEAVKGNAGADNKPVVEVENSKELKSQTEKIISVYDVNTTNDTLNVYYKEWENEGVLNSIQVFPNDTIVEREVNLETNKSRTVKIWPSR